MGKRVAVILILGLTAGLLAQETPVYSDYERIKDIMRAVNTRNSGAFYTDVIKESINRLHPNHVQVLLSDIAKEKNSLKLAINTDAFKQECLDASGVATVAIGAGLALCGKIPNMITCESNDLTTKIALGIIGGILGGGAGIITMCFLTKHDQLAQDLHDNKEKLKMYVALEEALRRYKKS